MSDARSLGRPLGEFSRAVLAAVVHLEKPDSAPTVREIAGRLSKQHLRQLNDRELRSAIESLKQCEKIEIKRTRKVSYCCKPVAELGLCAQDAPQNLSDWHSAMSAWMGSK